MSKRTPIEPINLLDLPILDREYSLTPDEIMEVIWDGLEDFVEGLQAGDLAHIHIHINPGSVLISRQKKNMQEDDDRLGMSLEEWES